MKLYLSVKDFGRIKNAKICLSGLTLFVGDNNSGKSYLMQLAHGLFRYMMSNDFLDNFIIDIPENTEQYSIDKKTFPTILKSINNVLNDSKDKIVKYIFNSDIPISTLKLSIDDYNAEYTIVENSTIKSEKIFYRFRTPNSFFTTGFGFSSKISKSKRFSFCIAQLFFSEILHICKMGFDSTCRSIYLPSSRTGLLLLYRQFFSDKNTSDVIVSDTTTNNKLGLTLPTLDFLNFLQTYKPSTNNFNNNLLNFIFKNLADGTISFGLNEMQYQPAKTNLVIQMPLCSAMINELTPIVQVLTSSEQHQYIMYDEVETCLHPLKQIQMARLLVRLANSHRNIFVSTHSDTMAIALNNLFLLSYSHRDDKNEVLNKLGYTDDDLLSIDKPHVYQFNREGSKTTVSELEMSLNPNIGFSFEQFNKSSEKIFTDANEIMGG